MVWEIIFTTLVKSPLSVTIFITHLRIFRNGSCANVDCDFDSTSICMVSTPATIYMRVPVL